MSSAAILEVTSSCTRLAVFEVRKKQYVCTDCRQLDFDTEQEWTAELSRSITELLPELASAETFALSLPLEKTVYRKIVMPFANGTHISQTIAYSLEEFLSGPVENFSVTYRITGSDNQGQQNVECLCCEKTVISAIFSALSPKGLRPAIITASAIASANIFPLNGQPAVLTEINQNRAEVSYFDGAHFAGGRAFSYTPETFASQLRRTTLALNVPQDVSVCCPEQTASKLSNTEMQTLSFPSSEGEAQTPSTAPLYGLAKVVIEGREDTLNLCAGEFAPPGPLQKMAPVLLISSAMLLILLAIPFIKVFKDNKSTKANLTALKRERDRIFYSSFPKAPANRNAEEQKKFYTNALYRLSAHRGKNTQAQGSALEAWLVFYQALQDKRLKNKWWMTQLDARDNDLAMTVKSAKYEIGLSLLYLAMQAGGYEVSLDNLHRLDANNVTFILKAKKKEDE